MPKRKQAARKRSLPVVQRSYASASAYAPSLPMGFTKKRLLVALALILIVLLGVFKKNWFVAAIVNGKPISNFELQKKLNSQFREQILGQMINEKILLSEIEKNKVTVSESDINDRLAQIEKSLGGPEALDSLLAQQGQTRSSVKEQLHLQAGIEKLYEKEATFSAEELEKFMTDNRAQLTATEPAALQKEAETALKQQKLQAILSEKFKQLKESAKVTIF